MDLSTLSRIVGCPLPTALGKEYGAEAAPHLPICSGVEANSWHSGDEYSKGLELKAKRFRLNRQFQCLLVV